MSVEQRLAEGKPVTSVELQMYLFGLDEEQAKQAVARNEAWKETSIRVALGLLG